LLLSRPQVGGLVVELALVALAFDAGGPGPPPARENPGAGAGEATFVVEDGRLLRLRGGEATPIPACCGARTGAVRGIARDPAGLLWVAAEGGLFVTAPDVPVLDRVEPGPGAPQGEPTSVFVDAQRRVWLATIDSVGVLEPSHHWGRALEVAPALGPGPYLLRGLATGGIGIRGTEGGFRYRPDRGPAPVLETVLVDGTPMATGGWVRIRSGDELRLEAAGRAQGGATFLCRVDGHHVWIPFETAQRIVGLRPGTHRVEVVAVDRDLRRSAPASFGVACAYPVYYDERLVAATLATLSVAAFLALSRLMSRPRALASVALAWVVGLQLLAGSIPHARGWPFVGFAMYTRPHGVGDLVFDAGLYGVDAEGRSTRLVEAAAGVGIDDRWQVLRPLIDGGAPAARAWMDAYERHHPGRGFPRLQVRAERYRITAAGTVRVAPLILSDARLED